MADRNDIITLPDERLRESSKSIGVVDDSVKKLIDTMTEATLDWEDNRKHELAVALAAVQIGEMHRAVIVRSNMEDKSDRTFTVMLNPQIVKTYGEPEADFEGCLSIRDVYGKVPRYPKVKVKAKDMDGKEFRVTAKGFMARVLQHEIDHTNGTVFVDHIKDDEEAMFKMLDDGKLKPLDYDKEVKDSDVLWPKK